MKKYLAIIIALSMVLTLGSCKGPSTSTTEQPMDLIMATGGTSGTYYAFGGIICQTVNAATGYNITANSTGASVENVRLVASGEADLAIVQTDIQAYAVGGSTLEAFDGKPVENIKVIASLYPEVVHCVTTNLTLNNIGDLKGKTVSLGAPGSGVRANAEQFLEAYGITTADINVRDLSFAESGTALQDGTIDAAFIVAGTPNAAIVELSVSKPVKVLSLGDAESKALIAKYPFYGEYTIPKDVYKTEEDCKTLAIKAVLIVGSEMTDDAAYNITKALFDKQADLASAHAKGKELSLESCMIGVVPGNVHPGAAKFYKEKGVQVP